MEGEGKVNSTSVLFSLGLFFFFNIRMSLLLNTWTSSRYLQVLVTKTLFKIFIGIELIYNVALVSCVQQSESVTHTHVSTLSLDSFPIWATTEY